MMGRRVVTEERSPNKVILQNPAFGSLFREANISLGKHYFTSRARMLL